MNRLLLAFFVFLSLAAYAQDQNGTDEELAQQYYLNKQYDKAVPYYEKIYSKRPSNMVYHNYLECLLQTKDFKTAEKLVKKQMHQDQSNLGLWIDLGNTYTAAGDDKSATESYEKAIKNMPADRGQVIALGQLFIDNKKYDYALETYKKGKSELKDGYSFLFEIGAVYKLQGNIEAMVDSYLDALLVSDSFIQSVQDVLQSSVGENADPAQSSIVRKEVLKYIQKYSDNDTYPELLIWMLVQEKNYSDALVHIEALDKRKHESGERLMDFASTCVNNTAYDPAIQAYQYVINLGAKNNYNYPIARQEQLKVIYLKITSGGDYTHDQLVDMQTKFKQGLDELTHYAGTVSLMIDLAHLDAFYLRDDSDAINLMNEAVGFQGMASISRARCKMELADIYLESGLVWDASLIYSQIETELKHEPIGDEAKLKNAYIYYYTGNFNWAKAQLDILKGATSKLTANDAMALSLVIGDNMQDSTHLQPLFLFAHTQYLDFRNEEDSVDIYLDSIFKMTNTSTLKEEILMMRAKMSEKKGKYDVAMQYYQNEIHDYPDGILPDRALYNMAQLEDKKLNDQTKAADFYKQIILNYPGSIFIEEVRERYRHLVKDDAPPVN